MISVSDTAILYDADCGFCRVSVALVLSVDTRRRLRPVALQDPEADRLLAEVPVRRRLDSWHLVLPGGEVRSAGAALAPLLELLPGGGPAARLSARLPDAAERGYRWVAERRSAFGSSLPGAAKEWADDVINRRTATRPSDPS